MSDTQSDTNDELKLDDSEEEAAADRKELPSFYGGPPLREGENALTVG